MIPGPCSGFGGGWRSHEGLLRAGSPRPGWDIAGSTHRVHHWSSKRLVRPAGRCRVMTPPGAIKYPRQPSVAGARLSVREWLRLGTFWKQLQVDTAARLCTAAGGRSGYAPARACAPRKRQRRWTIVRGGSRNRVPERFTAVDRSGSRFGSMPTARICASRGLTEVLCRVGSALGAVFGVKTSLSPPGLRHSQILPAMLDGIGAASGTGRGSTPTRNGAPRPGDDLAARGFASGICPAPSACSA
jgi:hypothetical protein